MSRSALVWTLPPAVLALGGLLALSAGAPPPSVPLVEGLTVVMAASDPPVGDYESLAIVSNVAADGGMSVTISGDVPIPMSDSVQHVRVERHVRAADLKNGRVYKYYFSTDDPPEFPGTTAIGTSAAVIGELRATGKAAMGVNGESAGIGGLLSSALGVMSGDGDAGGLSLGANASGTVRLVEARVVPFAVLLNGARVSLPAWHIKGHLDQGDQPVDVEFWILDDPANPLILRFNIGKQKLDVVRIDIPTKDDGKVMERELAADRRTILYGIYFDFNSAQIKPQSDPVLKEIVQVMRREPSWKLRIEGHTDSVGGDAAQNKALSARRAEAVKAALVQRGISALRLDIEGMGAASPREPNTTLQGRARNRRVELTRE
jgi:outer membrane protein OmpA-like peptidoglycan-associated protein